MNKEILRDKYCFISGASGGIGKAIALKMAEKGCNLFLTSRNASKLENVQQEIASQYGQDLKIFHKAGDLNNIEDIESVIAKTREVCDSVDILVNCAGVFPVNFLLDSNLEDYDCCFNVNTRAAFLFCREFCQDMKKRRWGRVINIGSSSSYAGFKETSIYCASKHALLGFSRALHAELKEYNIRSFCISPGSVKTEMGTQVKNQNYNTFIDPEEIAEYIVFIISSDDTMVCEEIRLNRMVIE